MSRAVRDHLPPCLLAALLGTSGCAGDPASLWLSRQETRSFECNRVSQDQAHELRPGIVPERSPRAGTFEFTDALICERRYLAPGERPARDEAILSSLRASAQEIAQLATVGVPEGTTWLVDAFYPEPMVASKISVAVRTELVERRHRVSDQVPVLAAGDIAVLRRLKPSEAYPLACSRYFAEHSLSDQQRFLGLMIVDARETQLHAGLCSDGKWRWLR
jgi:hypothetical protein